MDFVLALHSHIPYVLHHGRWPHGSDWLCEAALDAYLPLLESLRRLDAEGVPAPVTVGITPVLANQLASPAFAAELEAFVEQRIAASDEAPAALAAAGETALVPIVAFWRARLVRLRHFFSETLAGDIVGGFAELEAAGRLELIGSAATHAFLPLLARDESIRLQLALGRAEHRRLFGREPAGVWLPECAYRPRGPWEPWPTAPRAGLRRGIEEHLGDAGYRYCFIDAHLAGAGQPLGLSGDPAGTPEPAPLEAKGLEPARTPYRAYRIAPGRGTGDVAVLVRDPRVSLQVWSRYQGYPGDEAYLEFHKMRWPGGLKLWRVSAPGSDLGDKQPYDPGAALARAAAHAGHFAALLGAIRGTDGIARDAVVAAPFDTELFGHWWFEGPEFLAGIYREIGRHGTAHPTTARTHLAAHPARGGIRLPWGSWGANGDAGMWLNQRTAWTWERLWALEQRFWDLAPAALARAERHPVLAQAARELLLAQSSDWQFIISTGAAEDYAERRFAEHAGAAERLLATLEVGRADDGDALERGRRMAAELACKDDLFPDVLPAVAAALGGSRSVVLT